FVLIQPGTFVMGSPEGETGRSSDEVQHNVTLTQKYYLQTTEVTQGQWKAVMGSNPSYFSSCGDECPVEKVSWEDVQEFIEKLNLHENANRYKLPTEAQWEYAARSGSTTALANGNLVETNCSMDTNLNAMGWYCGNADNKTHQVAQKQANAWGLFDMHGNVWEWCSDWLGGYSDISVTDPGGASSGSTRVLRGGSWYDGAQYCRSANRSYSSPGTRSHSIGLRLSRTP
ncbi:serine/threonine protein kinase, partial [Candidatus Magnetomorum sp. HK-1]